ncbi:MAG TPA: YihY/virulence factor BrkB family protein [Candidatus Saccharimonadales bacterium]|nr:YihY/virulence factor BrkB family protein [Candidatus Saccharimonadales bacterium]
MESIKWPLKQLDKLQQRFKPVAFGVAVFKKYGEDEGGRLTALITYYGFLSLFPLLLVATTATQLFLKNHEHIRARVVEGIGHYFPVISNHFQGNIHSLHKTGLALALGILITLYGARGGADAIRYAFNQIWRVPKDTRPGFPRSILNSLSIILVGGGGLVLASVLSSYAAGLAHVFVFRLIPFIASLAILIFAFYQVYSLGINSREPTRKDLLVSAIAAAVGVQILQLIGGYLLTHELKNLSNLYGTFAVVLGLMFWIYLQVLVLLFAAFAGAVHAKKLWPRKIIS